MAALNPRAPTRKQLKKIFGDDKRLIKSFEQLFEVVPDTIESNIEEATEALFSWVGPALSSLSAQISKLGPRTIQFKSGDYTLIPSDSGVVSDSSSIRTYEMPSSSLWTDQNKFVQNAGTEVVHVVLVGDQQVSGVDVLILESDTPHVTANIKSDGSNLILLSDRSSNDILGANYWVDETGDRMVDETGDELIFVI
jgi:hypothetical protein